MPVSQQRLGEYVLLDRIGGGTFGEVWRARHHAWSDQIVAVKIPTDPKYVQNLQKEGFAIQRLSHPCIVKPISFDPYASPAYLVMEFVPGCSLRQLINHGPIPIDDAVAVMKRVLAALHHAHGSGLVHRDIKPENILIHERMKTDGLSTKGVVKLTDFGLGRTVTRNEQSIVFSEDQRDARRIVGSRAYMSPEQVDGMEVDAKSDLYSCGVVLFEMLTGKRPAGTEIPSELNPTVPKAMDDVFRRAFARKEKRFESAEEFFNALKVAALTYPKDSGGKRDARMSRLVVIGACVVAFVAIAIAIPIILYSARSAQEPIFPPEQLPGGTAVAKPAISSKESATPSPDQTPTTIPIASSAAVLERPTESVPTPESSARVIDLLKAADPAQDTLSGHWSLSGGSLFADPQRPWSRLEFMYQPPAEYDYRVTFTRTDGDDIIPFILSAEGHQFALSIAGDHNKTCTFEDIQGKYINASTRYSDAWLTNGRRYTCVIKVRKDGVSAFLDGELINEWKTDYRDMSLDGGWILPRNDTLGLGNADSNRTVFHSVEVVEITGSGNRLRQPPEDIPQASGPFVSPQPVRTLFLPPELPATSPTATNPSGGQAGPHGGVFGHGGNAFKIVYICDASGSMMTKIDQLKNELQKSVQQLQPAQAFDVIFFHDVVNNPSIHYIAFNPDLVIATANNKMKFYAFLRDVAASYDTHVIPALTMAFHLPNRPDLIYLLTDGAFEGEGSPTVIDAIAKLNAGKRVKINTILFLGAGIGGAIDDSELKEASTAMRRIAGENGGTYNQVSVGDLGN